MSASSNEKKENTDNKGDKKRPVKGGKPKTYEEIIGGFQKLRTEQRILTQKIAEMEIEQQEHKLVIATLKKTNSGRKCFRMIGGVLCERTVGEVLPVLITHEERLTLVLDALNKQLVAKGVEINTYKEQNNVRVKGVDDIPDVPSNEAKPSGSGGVLVSS